MISIRTSGNFNNTLSMLRYALTKEYLNNLDTYGSRGVDALRSATPKDTGDVAAAWSYEIQRSSGSVSVVWTNSCTEGAQVPIAILIQYGHGTRNGGYVQGRDFINPAMRPVFDEMADEAWKLLCRK